MSIRVVVAVLAMGSVAAPAMADHAQPRGGGSSSSSAGERHHGGSSNGGGSSGGGSGGGGSYQPQRDSGSGGHSASERTTAERRHPRAGTGTGSWPGYSGRYGYYPYFYGGGYSSYWPYYFGAWWPYDYYGGGYGYGYGYPYGGYGYAPRYYSYRSGGESAAIRVFVEPEKTKVFVDGYYAGVADDFDGLLQRLYVAPGRHEITFQLEGYRPHRVRVYVTPGSTLKIEHDMFKGGGEETFEDLSGGRYDREPPRPDRYDDEDDDAPPARDRPSDHGDQPFTAEAGRLHLDVRPADASVYVDGEFKGLAGKLGEVSLPPGPHRVEVVRPGFRTEERDVDVAPGSSREISIELQRP